MISQVRTPKINVKSNYCDISTRRVNILLSNFSLWTITGQMNGTPVSFNCLHRHWRSVSQSHSVVHLGAWKNVWKGCRICFILGVWRIQLCEEVNTLERKCVTYPAKLRWSEKTTGCCWLWLWYPCTVERNAAHQTSHAGKVLYRFIDLWVSIGCVVWVHGERTYCSRYLASKVSSVIKYKSTFFFFLCTLNLN